MNNPPTAVGWISDFLCKALLLVSFVLILICPAALVGHAGSGDPQALQDDRRVKIKNDRTIVRDKSKPVRKAIEEWYGRNIQAFKARDVAAVMALRTDDFQTFTPDGKVNTRSDMEAYTRRFLDRIDRFISLGFGIGIIDVQGDLASADVIQTTIRMQRLPDGSLHRGEARAVQRETWKKTTEGWKLHRVNDVRDAGVFVDDQPYKPNE